MSYQSLTHQDKLDMINFYEKERPDLQVLADRFNVGKMLAANIIKNRESILKNGDKEPTERKRKGFFNPQGKIIDESCYEWYLKCIKEGKPVSGKSIKETAMKIARSIKHKEFGASNGWLQKWRARHNVILKPFTKTETEQFLYKHQTNENGTHQKKFNVDTLDYRKNSQKVAKLKKFGVKLPVSYKKPKKSLNTIDLEENDSDPLAFNEFNSGSIEQRNAMHDEDILFEGERESLFKIDGYEAALNAIEDLKNFAQDDDIALNYLNKIESHFQKERLK